MIVTSDGRSKNPVDEIAGQENIAGQDLTQIEEFSLTKKILEWTMN